MSETTETYRARLRDKWNLAAQALVGRKIVEARYLTEAECEDQGWQRSTLMILLDNGMTIFPRADDEGNDAGSLIVLDHIGKVVGMPVVSI
jgi:hypothetical protein